MIKHVVCFKFAEPTEASLKKAREILLSMKGNVPTAKEIQVGEDILHSNRSYDLYLSVVVDDRKALDEYANDEYHCSVVKTYMHSVVSSSVTVDFEF